MPSDQDFLQAARYPFTSPQQRGPWRIDWRSSQTEGDRERFGYFDGATFLSKQLDEGWREIVMTDTERALRRWLPLWRNAKGRVLLTGLGIGCAARGLLLNPQVTCVHVVEIDWDVIELVASNLETDPRGMIFNADAFTFNPPDYDWAWHDLSLDGVPTDQLNQKYDYLHRGLIEHYRPFALHQGFFAMPEPVIVY